MTVRSIDLHHVAVPLRTKIKHASHARTTSDNLVVRVVLNSGHVGFGEGVPRTYVTGETLPSAFTALSRLNLAKVFGSPTDTDHFVAALRAFTLPEIEDDPRGMFGNSARCAVELAVMDAYGRAFEVSVGHFVRSLARLDPNGPPHPVRYSGAITAESARKEMIAAIKMRIYGFSQVKVKVGVEGQDDPARMRRFRRILGSNADLRVDANEAWNARDLVDRVRPLLPSRPSLLEQPVPHAEVDALAELRPRLGLPVMLDESLCGYPDAERSIRSGTADVFNVRLSKCGGVGPTLRIMELAARSGLGIHLGCHPGETGLLSAAGRHVAANVPGIRYLEGSYDRHILADNVIREDITFGFGGRAKPLVGPGLGVTVDPEALERLTVLRQEIRFD